MTNCVGYTTHWFIVIGSCRHPRCRFHCRTRSQRCPQRRFLALMGAESEQAKARSCDGECLAAVHWTRSQRRRLYEARRLPAHRCVDGLCLHSSASGSGVTNSNAVFCVCCHQRARCQSQGPLTASGRGFSSNPIAETALVRVPVTSADRCSVVDTVRPTADRTPTDAPLEPPIATARTVAHVIESRANVKPSPARRMRRSNCENAAGKSPRRVTHRVGVTLMDLNAFVGTERHSDGFKSVHTVGYGPTA